MERKLQLASRTLRKALAKEVQPDSHSEVQSLGSIKKKRILEIGDKRRIPSYRPSRGWQMITGRANSHHSGLEGQMLVNVVTLRSLFISGVNVMELHTLPSLDSLDR